MANVKKRLKTRTGLRNGRGHSQLHDEVQVVGALVDVLQSDNVLVLYPAGQKDKKTLKLAC